MSPYIVCYILGCCITLLYFYLYNIGFLYYTNIQYTQLLSWAILGVHIYYPVSFILGYSNVPMLSDLTSFYWSTLIEQDFMISPLSSMILSSLLGSLYWTSIIMIRILYLGYSNSRIIFLIQLYFWSTLLTHILIYYLYFLVYSMIPILITMLNWVAIAAHILIFLT